MTASGSDALVLFGVTGDLAHKMTFPALYAMAKQGTLKAPVIGVAFPKWSLAPLRERVTDSIKRSGGIDNQRAFRHLLSLLSYVSGDYNDGGTFTAIKKALGSARRPAYYLAIPPSLFETVIKGLGATWPSMRESLSKSLSDATSRPRGHSTTSRRPCSRKTRSSASITSSGRKRS
jgi:glucose-6-phosphate 1-dehydrogenase